MKLETFGFKAMGSPCQLQIYSGSGTLSKAVVSAVKAEIERLENKYTRFKHGSLTSQINANAGNNSTSIDSETSKLLAYADTLYTQSDGLFDITSGILRRAWDFKSGKVPTEEDLAPLLPLVNWSSVEWKSDSIFLPKQGMQLDFGGFVKEYTADVIANLAREKGIRHGLVNLGGDIRVIGPHPDGKAWKVGIQHPRNPSVPITTVHIYQGGIATSGDYERYMIVDGIRYCHLLNPKTGKSTQTKFSSVSVIADSCLIAGSCATITALKSETQTNWIEEIGLPYLCINQKMKLIGTLTPTVE